MDILEMIKSNIFLVVLSGIILLLFILYIITIIKLSKLNKNYTDFMLKMGKGENIQENIKKYSLKVEQVENKNKELEKYCENIENKMENCIQKIGLVRYNAFKDTGSDLSFTLALLDNKNTGIVLNGIYSRETSNIYSKPVEKGTSTYTLSDEEKQAIQKAINSK